ncbi:type II toxin-antitoxin system HicB family antitoxin [Sphaerospermopsis sp. LEGE 08334]|jgi:antitoxin HicB|uniref:type II toxin-antitoxin system HicB family antitoxin n=1 Tax=Sphaerospermopsis sp. LEGE 08334 TaxID=1828651 RepID=UPI001882993C|nr:type II toxin-antitoxin system HicB family antitoxin [Sphaerospermopsis sp. LEGE 08334]MBE9055083.1 type II toxin-antitoxin system HicB family antitoxin [Sphaerospermopsis sp. LEGE 08334]
MNLPYTIIIHWSNEDQCYLVHLPEFPTQKYHTHGNTYEEAVKNAQEVIEMLVSEYQEDGKPLPIAKSLEQLLNVA